MYRFSVVMASLLFIIGCQQELPSQSAISDSKKVNILADEYVNRYLEYMPWYGTALGLPDASHGAIMDPSFEAEERWNAIQDSLFAELETIDATGLEGTQEWLTLGFLKESLLSNRQSRVCKSVLWRVSQMGQGWQTLYPLIADIQPVGSPSLREAALKRFGGLPDFVDKEIENLREGLRTGYTAPVIAVERVLDQLDGLLVEEVESSAFWGPARRDSAGDFRETFALLITESVNPAIKRYKEFLEKEYLPHARLETAITANPQGATCYNALLRSHTTLDLSAEEVHQLGLDEMERIVREMKEVGVRSFDTDSVPELLEKLRTEKEFLFNNREEIQHQAEAALERAKRAMNDWFGRLPKADVVVEAVPDFMEASTPAGFYNAPAEDGSRPGTYNINLGNPETQPRAMREAIAFHETIPGHHLQQALSRERPSSHRITRFIGFGAFSEGWGLYSERLADEMGLYSSDLDRIGMLSSLAVRAARLVVDTGLHAKGWTRQQAIDYMLAHTLVSEEQIAVEVDRYIIIPGQATSYMVGSNEIWRLRSVSEQGFRR